MTRLHVFNAPSITDSLRIFYIGRPAGWEHYELKQADSGFALTSDYEYADRGRRNHLQLTLPTGQHYALKTYEGARLTDSSRTVTTSIAFEGPVATVTRGGKASKSVIPPVACAVSAYAPTAQHLPLIRYWKSHGRPATMAIVPADPNPVIIQKQLAHFVAKKTVAGMTNMELENISNIRTVRFVMKDGKIFESARLWSAAGFNL